MVASRNIIPYLQLVINHIGMGSRHKTEYNIKANFIKKEAADFKTETCLHGSSSFMLLPVEWSQKHKGCVASSNHGDD